MKALEDQGYFCVDNLPVVLFSKFFELLEQSSDVERVALVVDIRERDFLREFNATFAGLKKEGYDITLLFLDCGDEALVRRFSETRRRHPLAENSPVIEGIKSEREKLAALKSVADIVVDSSGLNVHQLKEEVSKYFTASPEGRKLSIFLISFGYKYGIPYNADMVFDARFIPNPYFVESLRHLSGKNPEVRSYVMDKEETRGFLSKVREFVEGLIPLFEKEGKVYLTIAVGCTGGRHRSVVLVEELAGLLQRGGHSARTSHRDMEKS